MREVSVGLATVRRSASRVARSSPVHKMPSTRYCDTVRSVPAWLSSRRLSRAIVRVGDSLAIVSYASQTVRTPNELSIDRGQKCAPVHIPARGSGGEADAGAGEAVGVDLEGDLARRAQDHPAGVVEDRPAELGQFVVAVEVVLP